MGFALSLAKILILAKLVKLLNPNPFDSRT